MCFLFQKFPLYTETFPGNNISYQETIKVRAETKYTILAVSVSFMFLFIKNANMPEKNISGDNHSVPV